MMKAAIVGLGWWGKTLVEAVQGSSEVIQFVAGTDRETSPDLVEFAATHGFDLMPSYEDVLGNDQVDAVVLATPHSAHTPQVVAAAAAGKHIFCEKPFALTAADATKAVEAVKAAGVTLYCWANR